MSFVKPVLKSSKFAELFGKRNQCNDGSKCAECITDQDCPTREVILMKMMIRREMMIILYKMRMRMVTIAKKTMRSYFDTVL